MNITKLYSEKNVKIINENKQLIKYVKINNLMKLQDQVRITKILIFIYINRVPNFSKE